MKKQTPLSLPVSLLIACFWPPPHTHAQDRDYAVGETLHVLATSGLRLRDAPSGKTVLATLPYGAKVIAGETAPYPPAEKIDGLAGSWIKATYKGKSGYVFDGYLGVFPAPDTAIHSLKAYADRYFIKKGKPFTHVYGEEETVDSIAIQHYTYRNMLIEVRENVYYENSEETLMVDPGFRVSNTEIYLLVKALFRQEIDRSLQEAGAGNFTPEDKNGPVKADKNYFNRPPEKDVPTGSFEIFGECANGTVSWGEWGNTLFIRIITGC